MKIPPKPPLLDREYISLWGKNLERASSILHGSIVDQQGRYLPWDELRRREPPGDLSVEEWWFGTRVARRIASQKLPIADPSGNGFTFCETPVMRAQLRELDMNAGGALGTQANMPSDGESKIYLARSLAEEPFASSFIEGAATTRQIAKKLIFENREPRTKDERMVLNNYRAMEFVRAHAKDALSLPLLLELHRLVTEDTLDNPADAGRIRDADDVRVVDETSGEILHQPPPAADLARRLDAFIAFANAPNESRNWIHPLLKAFLLHFFLAYEHPFVDGNGRVARALFYWAALKEGYWLAEYLSISSVIAESKIQYGKAFLHTELDEGDTTYFLLYHAEILQKSLERLAAFVKRKQEEVVALEKSLSGRKRSDAFNHRVSWLLNEFARNRLASITVEDHQMRHNVSYLTARGDLEALVKRRFLKKKKVGKFSVYEPVADFVKKLTGQG